MEGLSYWCHMCTQMVSPIMEPELKCPLCLGGFLEEMESSAASTTRFNESDLTPDRALSLWAPILLGMMGNNGNQRSRRRSRRHFLEDNGTILGDDMNENGDNRELSSVIRRRRRSTNSPAALQLLQGISETENERRRERERLLLIHPFNQDPNPHQFGSLGDYFIGPGLDVLLQHLAENDPNRHGTLPAQKAVVDALPTVKIDEIVQCPICLDEFEVASEGKEMPCKHRFHKRCIVPWLELHSSCPVCRFQLPADEAKHESEGRVHNGNPQGSETRFTLPWPLNTLTSASTSHRSSASTSGGSGTSSQADGN